MTTILPHPEEKLLRALAVYHYLTAPQLRLAVGYASQKFVYERLKRLRDDGYIEQVIIPKQQAFGSNPALSYLSAKGRRYLADLGVPLLKRAPRAKTRLAFEHIVASNDILIRCQTYQHPHVAIRAIKSDLTLKEESTGRVVPDGYVEFVVRDGEETYLQPVAFELDRNTESIGKWQTKVGNILDWANGRAITIAVVVTEGGFPRAAKLREWTEGVLRKRNLPAEADLFRFTAEAPELPALPDFLLGARWAVPFHAGLVPLIEGVDQSG